MQNEILKPVLDTDEVAVPRYDIVGPNGSVIQQNVELRLKNEVVQEGTPYDEESVLPASLREQLELPQSATPAEAMAALLAKSGGAVRRNRPPLTTDAERVGKLWVVPKMFFNNLMPNALTQVAGNWQSSNATVAVSGNTATFTGNGTESSVYAQAGVLANAKAGDKIFVQATVKVNHDANAATIQLTCGEQTLATKTLDVPAAGDTMLLQAVATVEASGSLALRLHSTYNTAAVQSGKSCTVSAITVWNLTEDMCEAQEGNEFTEQEAANYISSFGQFQSKEYEYSTWWWVLRGVTNGTYLWARRYDLATQQEAQEATDHTTLMTPLRTKQFLTKFTASQAETNAGTDAVKVITPATAAGLFANRAATTAEAQAGANANHWMSPKTTKDAITSIAPMLPAILSDETRGMYDLPSTSSPNELFAKLRIPLGAYGFKLTIKLKNGNPAVGFEIPENPLYALSTRSLKTDSAGVVYCYANSKTVSAVFGDGYLGVPRQTETLTADTTMAFTPVTVTLANDTSITSMVLLTSSVTYKLAGNIASADFCAVGGGGGGGPHSYSQFGGGAGGYAVNAMSKTLNGTNLAITVGSGGARSNGSNSSSVGGTGGTTTVSLDGTTIVTASGGQGAQSAKVSVGNGNGGFNSAGTNGTVRVFNDNSLPLPGGGGGDGNYAGGADFGGAGAYYSGGIKYHNNGSGPTGPGGGGSGMAYGIAEGSYHTAGYSGGVYMRVRYKT